MTCGHEFDILFSKKGPMVANVTSSFSTGFSMKKWNRGLIAHQKYKNCGRLYCQETYVDDKIR